MGKNVSNNSGSAGICCRTDGMPRRGGEGRWNIFKAKSCRDRVLTPNLMMWIFPLINEILLLLCTALMQVAFVVFASLTCMMRGMEISTHFHVTVWVLTVIRIPSCGWLNSHLLV